MSSPIPNLQTDAPSTRVSDLYSTGEVGVAYKRMTDAMQRLEDAISAILEGGTVKEKLLDALRSDFAAKCTIYQTLSSTHADIGAQNCAEPLTGDLQVPSHPAQATGKPRLQQSTLQCVAELPEKVL